MKKLFSLLSIILLLCGCDIERSEYYVFSFDDYTVCPGYDDVEFMRLVFDVDARGKLDADEKLEDVKIVFWGRHFADVDISNPTEKQIDIEQGKITRIDMYLDELGSYTYKIDDVVLSSSVKENCDMFNGEYIERNGYACVFGKVVDDRNNVVILHGDILKPDQDELSRIEIYVE